MLSLNFINELLYLYKNANALQCLHVGRESRHTHKRGIVYLEDSLEVCVDGHQLGGETGVSCDRHAVLASHGHHGVSVVVEY